MSEFKRENRYLVLKRKDIDKYLSDDAKEELDNILMALAIAKQPDIDTGADGEIDCVVVEHDWPMYEDTWKAIQRYVETGKYQSVEVEHQSDLQREKLELLKYVESVKLKDTGTLTDRGQGWNDAVNAIEHGLKQRINNGEG